MPNDFTELKIWQKAQELTIEIYKLTKKFPREELFGLTNQMRRAAVSVAANIAEGHGRRNKNEIIQFMLIARASIAEIRSHLTIALGLDYIAKTETEFINNEYKGLALGINVFVKSLKSSTA